MELNLHALSELVPDAEPDLQFTSSLFSSLAILDAVDFLLSIKNLILHEVHFLFCALSSTIYFNVVEEKALQQSGVTLHRKNGLNLIGNKNLTLI